LYLNYPSATLNTTTYLTIYPLVASFVAMYQFADDHDCVYVPPEETEPIQCVK